MRLTSAPLFSGRKAVGPTMLLTILGLWILLNAHFLGKYSQIIYTQPGGLRRAFAASMILWIGFTSFFACFHLMSFLFSAIARKSGRQVARNYASVPPVAILYPCMNDMQEQAIAACLAQAYPNYTLYILDDSTIEAECDRVDALPKRFGETVKVIRRSERTGFKAGNLNHALSTIDHHYTYVCVLDADELIPPTFLRELVAVAEANNDLCFVQAAHQQYGGTNYGKQTGDQIDLHWGYFLPARNWYGFVYFYGHGALLRLQTLVEVGGFPEIVSEDIALSAKFREAGYRGYYAHDITSLEEAPPSYRAFRRRNRKIVSGTLEFLTRFYPTFLRSPNVSLVEKLDLLISLSVIYLPVPFVCFLFLLNCIMPLLNCWSNTATTPVMAQLDSRHTQITVAMLKPLMSWDWLVFSFFIVFAPLCYLLPNAFRAPKKVTLYVLRMGTIHISMCLNAVAAALNWVVTKRVSFVPTGDRSAHLPDAFLIYIECMIGLGLIVVSLHEKNFFLMAIGLSLLLVPTLNKQNLNGQLALTLVAVPMLITALAVIGTPILLIGFTGIFTGIALAQH